MPRDERRLVRHLAWVVVIKLLALVGLWWMFVRDAHVRIDATAAAQRLAAPAPDQGEPR